MRFWNYLFTNKQIFSQKQAETLYYQGYPKKLKPIVHVLYRDQAVGKNSSTHDLVPLKGRLPTAMQ
jgi:hypothetical protein